MAHIITIANQKGGVGKTTTANALATGLILRGYKTLAIDTDPQGNLSYVMQADDQQEGLYEVLKGIKNSSEATQHTQQGDIIPSTLLLTGADMEFTDTGREYILKGILEPLEKNYDYIVIDSPPTLGILTINALTASNDIIIPMGADIFSLQGLSQLYNAISKVKKFCNPALNIAGLLITRYNGRTILSKDLREVIEQKAIKIGATVFNTIIREGISIKEAQTQQDSIFSNNPNSNPAQDYKDFVNEYLKGAGKNEK
jgi:chromosome partitioning protein